MGSVREPQEETMPLAIGRLSKQSVLGALSALVLIGTGCSGLFGPDDGRAGLACLDDSPECVEQRQVALKSMIADKDRKWVREPATPEAHASGVRLFAFRSRKKELSCEELAHGKREADNAPKALRGPEGKALSPAQISRASMFAAEVSKELGAEMRLRRCKA
jgi:hypothetical protein